MILASSILASKSLWGMIPCGVKWLLAGFAARYFAAPIFMYASSAAFSLKGTTLRYAVVQVRTCVLRMQDLSLPLENNSKQRLYQSSSYQFSQSEHYFVLKAVGSSDKVWGLVATGLRHWCLHSNRIWVYARNEQVLIPQASFGFALAKQHNCKMSIILAA